MGKEVTVKVKGIGTFRERRMLSLVSVMRRDRNTGKREHPRRRQHLYSRLGRARPERVEIQHVSSPRAPASGITMPEEGGSTKAPRPGSIEGL